MGAFTVRASDHEHQDFGSLIKGLEIGFQLENSGSLLATGYNALGTSTQFAYDRCIVVQEQVAGACLSSCMTACCTTW